MIENLRIRFRSRWREMSNLEKLGAIVAVSLTFLGLLICGAIDLIK